MAGEHRATPCPPRAAQAKPPDVHENASRQYDLGEEEGDEDARDDDRESRLRTKRKGDPARDQHRVEHVVVGDPQGVVPSLGMGDLSRQSFGVSADRFFENRSLPADVRAPGGCSRKSTSSRMPRDVDVQEPTPVVGEHHEHVENVERGRRHREEVTGRADGHVARQEGPPDLPRRSLGFRRAMDFATVVSPTSCSRSAGSSVMRGAPQVGFSRLICLMRKNSFIGIDGRPTRHDFDIRRLS